jgi:hypothetical protein
MRTAIGTFGGTLKDAPLTRLASVAARRWNAPGTPVFLDQAVIRRFSGDRCDPDDNTAIYHRNTDGHLVELFYDLDR